MKDPYIDKSDWPWRRYTPRPDGIERIDIRSLGVTGRTIYGTPANGHWKLHGYRKDGLFSRSFRGLKAKLQTTTPP